MRAEMLRDPDKERVIDVEGLADERKENESGGNGEEQHRSLRKPLDPDTARRDTFRRLGSRRGHFLSIRTISVIASQL